MSSPPRSLSVVVPCFDEELRIGASLAQLCDTLTEMSLPEWEVLVVDDQSTDRTAAIVESWAAMHPQVHLARAQGGKGKGAAVRTGVLLARYDAVLVVDADLAADLGVVPQMCQRLASADVVIGSRLLSGAVVEPARSLGRRTGALVFRTAVRLMTTLRVTDPQCGCKMFRRDVVQPHIAELRTNGYAYEIELLLRLTKSGAVIEEIPVTWREGRDSKVRVLSDGFSMLGELWSARTYAR
ncbi:MAG TPA: glycosyltransferase [Ilumatobacteraceae bacterium]|nr:glycosyltransferase [Ilumatobacteraceae bacterium]